MGSLLLLLLSVGCDCDWGKNPLCGVAARHKDRLALLATASGPEAVTLIHRGRLLVVAVWVGTRSPQAQRSAGEDDDSCFSSASKSIVMLAAAVGLVVVIASASTSASIRASAAAGGGDGLANPVVFDIVQC